MPGKNARQHREKNQCQGKMPGNIVKRINARQECQANARNPTMPGKNARQTPEIQECQARMPGKRPKSRNAREECQASARNPTMPGITSISRISRLILTQKREAYKQKRIFP
ncbi:hypothetical protein [Bacillus sp. SJS]|uniref:hypothetical protein n=1 Tax=Bacillus sp. SJS TaxID=1423321 RepID=UPI0012E8400E|nr:hypothetical protein [Bacillus sp. SJS]